MNYFLKTLMVIYALAMSGLLAAHPHNADSLTYSIKSITIASEPDYPPYCIVNEKGEADGFSVDLFKAAVKAVGIEMDIKIGVWNQIMQELAEGRIDALPLVGRTPEREELFDFTMPYLRLHGAIFIRKNTKGIESIEDLHDRTIAVMKDDNAEDYARRNRLSNNIITTHTFDEAFKLLNAKEVDAVIVQKVVGLEIIKNLDLKGIVPLNLLLSDFRQDFCFAVQKGNTELLARLNEGLSIVIASKTYDEIHLKWFGPKYKEEISLRDYINIGTKLIVPVILILSLVLIVVLRRMVYLRTKQLKQEVLERQNTNLLLEKMERVSKVGGWDYNIKTKKIIWTKGVYFIYGVSPEEFDPSSKDINMNFYHPDDKEILDLAFQKLLTTGESYDLELRFTDAMGVEKWVWTSGQAEYQSGKIVRVFGSIMDVTDSKVAELAVLESETRMREIFNSTNEAIIIHEANSGEIIDCNKSTLEIYGYSTKEELIGKGVGDISLNEHPYNEDEGMKLIKNAIEKGTQTFEWIAKKKSGKEFWVEVSLRFIELEKQKSILAVVRDTSERKKSQLELLRLNNEIQAIFKASKPLQYLKTPEKLAYEIIHILEDILNYEYCAVLLKDEDGLTLKPFALSDQGNGNDFVEEDKKYIISNEIRVGKGIVGWVAKNGKGILSNDVTKDPRYESLRPNIQSELCVPIISDSIVIGVVNIETSLPNAYTEADVKILETISAQIGIAIQNANLYQQVQKELNERRAVEDKLRELNEGLEAIVEERTKELEEQVKKLDKSQKAMLYMIEDLNSLTDDLKKERENLAISNKELEAFSYSVSHDLRAPLRAIDGFSRIFIEDYGNNIDEEGVRLLNVVRENTPKMDRLITDLLTLSRVTRAQLALSEIDMSGMARSMYHEVIGDIDSSKVSINIKNIPRVLADTTLIRQVWQNLISNAIKYSSPKESIEIEIGGEENDSENIYYIKDNGVGFNPEYKSKIFETFQRLHRADEFEGTGIGLSVVHRIVTRHGGRVWADSEEGRGSIFWFSIPNNI